MSKRLALVASAAVGTLAPFSAFAQTATNSPITAAGELASSGVDLTQLPAAVAIGSAAVIGVSLAFSVVMIIRRMARAAR